MPTANPFSPVIEVGGGATAGPASASANVSVGDHHATAAYVLIALGVLYALHKFKWRFSTQVG